MRRKECFFRTLDVSPEHTDAPKVGTKLLAGQEGFRLRLEAEPAQPENLGAVDAAAAVDAAYGLAVTPPLHRLGPLFREVVLRERLQCAHELAVDDPRREGIEFAGDGSHAGFVEES